MSVSKTLERTQYYVALAYWLLAVQAEKEVHKLSKVLNRIIKDEKLMDSIYDINVDGTKEEFDELLLKAGIEVEWKPKESDKPKEESQ